MKIFVSSPPPQKTPQNKMSPGRMHPKGVPRTSQEKSNNLLDVPEEPPAVGGSAVHRQPARSRHRDVSPSAARANVPQGRIRRQVTGVDLTMHTVSKVKGWNGMGRHQPNYVNVMPSYLIVGVGLAVAWCPQECQKR